MLSAGSFDVWLGRAKEDITAKLLLEGRRDRTLGGVFFLAAKAEKDVGTWRVVSHAACLLRVGAHEQWAVVKSAQRRARGQSGRNKPALVQLWREME